MAAHLPPRFRAEHVAVAPDSAAHWDVLLHKSWRLWQTPVVIAPADLKRIQAPALVIAGDHDFVSIDETLELWRGLLNAQLLILPDTAHATLSTKPEIVDRLIADFLQAP